MATTVSCPDCDGTAPAYTCTEGNWITPTITTVLTWTTGADRYDLVYVTKINSTTCTAETPKAASGDFKELDGDACYDAHPGGGNTVTYTLSPVPILCKTDSTASSSTGKVSWNVCFGYESSGSDVNPCMSVATAVQQGVGSKCKCIPTDLDITVIKCGTDSCPAWANTTALTRCSVNKFTRSTTVTGKKKKKVRATAPLATTVTTSPNCWPADATPTDICIEHTGQCYANPTCSGETRSGHCMQNRDPSQQFSCFYAFKNTTTVCRAVAGICDVEEKCDGTRKDCPTDEFLSGNECRAKNGACDVAETCNRNGPSCPNDGVAAGGVECRPVAGVCDVAEACDGTNKGCPPDVLLTTVCRSIAGPCDLAESCDGVHADCPTDLFRPSSYECTDASGCCDKDDYCTGGKAACDDGVQGPSTPCLQAFGPAGVNSPTGGTCGTGSPCVRTWMCDGSSKLSPIQQPTRPVTFEHTSIAARAPDVWHQSWR